MRGLTTLLIASWACLGPKTACAQPSAHALDGNSFVVQVLDLLKQRTSIAAKIRHESRLRDQQLVGSGYYWQQRTGSQRVTRWEMQTQIAGQTASFVQVYDGDYLWTDRHLPSSRQIRRLDVDWLQARLRGNKRGQTLTRRETLLANLQGQGGLGQMLADLLRNFDFQPPQPTQLNGLPVNALVGIWRPERLEHLWSAATQLSSDDPPAWPEHLPHHVLLLVGKNMFPHVCEHRREDDASLATSLAGLRPSNDPLVRYEIFEVQFAVDIPTETFQFLPGDLPWTDETSIVLEQLTKGEEEVAKTAALGSER